MSGAADRGLDLLERSVHGFYAYLYLSEFCRFLDPCGKRRGSGPIWRPRSRTPTRPARRAFLYSESIDLNHLQPSTRQAARGTDAARV